MHVGYKLAAQCPVKDHPFGGLDYFDQYKESIPGNGLSNHNLCLNKHRLGLRTLLFLFAIAIEVCMDIQQLAVCMITEMLQLARNDMMFPSFELIFFG